MLSSFIIGVAESPGKLRPRNQDTSFAINDDSLRGKTSIFFEYFMSNIYLLSFTVYGLWIMVGVIFYAYYENWTAATAFYYALEAGNSHFLMFKKY